MIKTRFAPEPSGYLHLGHLKAVYLNHRFAEQKGGQFLIRIDDSNPDTCQEEYVVSILDDLKTLPIKIDGVVYISDYFDVIEGFALQLLKNGLAYIEDLSPQEISQYREQHLPSPNRDQTVDKNLLGWQQMLSTQSQPNKCVRLKITTNPDHSSTDELSTKLIGSQNFYYPVIFVTKETKHYRKGYRKVYPLYDFISPIMDSLLGITHVFRSNEFAERGHLHDWILDQLQLPKPVFSTYLRMNIEHTILSKRKLRTLIENGYLKGWDDPHCPTVQGLRNRGYLVEAFWNLFAENEHIDHLNLITWDKVNHYQRLLIDSCAPRVAGISNKQILITIENAGPIEREKQILVNPKNTDGGSRTLHLPTQVLIDERDLANLSDGQKVVLMNYGYFQYHKASATLTGVENPVKRQHKYILSWVDPDSISATIIEYLPLFSDREVSSSLDILTQVNKTKERHSTFTVEKYLTTLPVQSYVQILRTGYFQIKSIDPQLRSCELIHLPDNSPQYLLPTIN